MNRDLLSRLIAAVLITVAIAAFFGWYDQLRLARIEQMTPQAYYDHAKQLASELFIFRFVGFLVMGVFYLVFIEVVAFVVRMIWRQPQE